MFAVGFCAKSDDTTVLFFSGEVIPGSVASDPYSYMLIIKGYTWTTYLSFRLYLLFSLLFSLKILVIALFAAIFFSFDSLLLFNAELVFLMISSVAADFWD